MTLTVDFSYWTAILAFAPYPHDEAEFEAVCDRLFSLTAAVISGPIGRWLRVTYCIDGGTWHEAFAESVANAASLMPDYQLVSVQLQLGGLEDQYF